MNCPVCNGEISEDAYCKLHAEVYGIILKKYDQWKKAKGISWKEYLSEIAKNQFTGEWAREMAQHLIEMENRKNVKNG